MSLTCSAAMTSRVCDEVLQLSMTDDQLPVVLPEVDRIILSELEGSSAAPASMRSFLAEVSGVPPRQLRSDAMMAGVTAAGYIQARVWSARR
eukprot:11270312-Alexandrium_andersonii.AAC.1